MDTYTETSKTGSRSASAIGSFGPKRHAPSGVRQGSLPRLISGASPIGDPRRDLRMFDLYPGPQPTLPSGGDIGLRRTRGEVMARTRAVGPVDQRGEAAEVIGLLQEVTSSLRGSAAPALRLTARAYKLIAGLIAGAIVICSALTVAQGPGGPSVAATHMVVRGGESVESIAERAAEGRDVDDVAQLIRAANRIAFGEMLRAGDIVFVPGS